jgi:mono/diheme cytochrome c family protein
MLAVGDPGGGARMRRLVCSGLIAGVLWLAAILPAHAQVSAPPQDPVAGSRVFGAKGCVKCHAVNGIGGKVGPDLARIVRPRSFYDLATSMWNHLPRMADRMQQMGIVRPHLDVQEAADLIGFLYTLNYFDTPGTPAVGRRLFTEKRCIVCHQVDGVGGVVGPNLDFLRPFRSPIYVAAAMWNHGPQMTEAMKARGIARPTFTGAELRDLIAFLAPGTGGSSEGAIYVLPGRADNGRRLFAEKRCAECHAIGGESARVGPNLGDRAVRKSPIDFAAEMWNKAPRMLAEMRPRGITAPQLRPEDMADLIGYLHSVRYFAEPGNVQRGWAVATAKGCLTCHAMYAGERGKPASDLTQARLPTPAAVVAVLWNHALVTAPAPGGGKLAWPEFRPEEMADLAAMLSALGRGR